MSFLLHENETGSFRELAHASDIDFGQLSLLTINSGCTRGGHYHTHKHEWFLVLRGDCVLMTEGVNVDINNRVLNLECMELYPCYPFEKHWISNVGPELAEVLVFTNEIYDPDDPDTIKDD